MGYVFCKHAVWFLTGFCYAGKFFFKPVFCFSLRREEEVWQEMYHFSGSVVRLVRQEVNIAKHLFRKWNWKGSWAMRWLFFNRSNLYYLYMTVGFQFFGFLFENKYKDFDCCYKKHLLILKILPKAASEFFFSFPSLSLVDFLQCPPLIGYRKILGRFTWHRRLSVCRNKLSEDGHWNAF